MNKIYLTLLLIVTLASTNAQDAHFSQCYEAPLLLNPARAGMINATYQLSGIYRSQWNNVTLPFKTITGTAQFNLPAGKNKNNIIGLAITDYADKAGDASYTTNHFDGTFSFHRNFGSDLNQYIGGGITAGFASTSFDYSKLTFDEDFNGGINSEAIGSEKANYFDLSSGIEYNRMQENEQVNVGFAVFHLTEPTVSYSNNSESVIYRKYVLNAGYAKTLSDKTEVLPRAAVFIQGPSRDFIFGTDLKFRLTQNATTNYNVYAGLYYRTGDALIPKFRIDMGDLSIAFSYDVTVSKVTDANDNAGGPELSLIYVGRVKGISAGRIYNPRF